MKCVAIKLSELGNRWDAGFHISRIEFTERAKELEMGMSEEDALTLIADRSVFPLEVLRLLQPLVRGQQAGADALLRAAEEYPFLALAIVSEGADATLKERQEALRAQIRKMEQTTQRLSAAKDKGVRLRQETIWLRATMQGIPDELLLDLKTHVCIAGVVYRAGDTLNIPVHTSTRVYIVDCWSIEVSDWAGDTIQRLIAAGDVPMPCLVGELGTPTGYVELPDHSRNYGAGWR